VSCLAGFLISILLLPPYIHFLKQRQLGQFIREEGPATHSVKASTPTMGGLCFLVATLAVSTLFLLVSGWAGGQTWLVALAALLCGLIGLVDDLAKIRRRENAGLSAGLRLALEALVGLLLGLSLLAVGGDTQILVPGRLASSPEQILSSPFQLPLAGYLALASFLFAATTNAVNLHDGMDGLCAGTAMQVLATLAFILLGTGQGPLAAIAAAGAGSLAGFLIFNRYPASIFMGDTGSLFIGGLMAALVIAGRIEAWFIPLALIYVLETLSVMVQVTYFKLTKDYKPDRPMSALALTWLKLSKRLPGQGRRFFRMAPLHHHFEAVGLEHGVSEWQVVACFWLAQLLLCAGVLVALPLS